MNTMWNGTFAPVVTKGKEWPGHMANPSFRILAVEKNEDIAYVGVFFNHTGPNERLEDIPSNYVEYVYQVELTPGQSPEMLEDQLGGLSTGEKIKYLEDRSIVMVSDRQVSLMHQKVNDLRRAEGQEPVRFTIDSIDDMQGRR